MDQEWTRTESGLELDNEIYLLFYKEAAFFLKKENTNRNDYSDGEKKKVEYKVVNIQYSDVSDCV